MPVNQPPDLPSFPPEPDRRPFGTQTSPPPLIVGDGQPYQPESKWKKALGPLAGLGIVIAKFFAQLKFFILPLLKFLPIILKTGGSMIFTIGIYAMFYGWKWAAGFVLLIFVHECGHSVAARQFGLKSTAPVFIPFMGAFILLKDAPRDAWMEAWVGIAGPIFGAVGGLICHALGLYFDSPLLVSLAYATYFLNLFNLTPLGQLDGGHVATALSPWMWVPGLGIMVWFAFQTMNPIVFIILLLSIPRVISLFRPRTEQEQRYFEVTPERRAVMAAMYFGLIALLIFGMQSTHESLLEQREMHRPQPAVSSVSL